MEGCEVGIALLDGYGAEGELDCDVVEGVGFWGVGEGGGRDGNVGLGCHDRVVIGVALAVRGGKGTWMWLCSAQLWCPDVVVVVPWLRAEGGGRDQLAKIVTGSYREYQYRYLVTTSLWSAITVF